MHKGDEKDGERKHTNRLIHESSPYLQQHAHNPVDWYPWGPEALEKARREDMPIMLSIGYSACHWCHRLREESFEDEETAALLNELFVSIKVDREERPDLDGIYMQTVQMMTGSGGWPLTVFLRPDGAPFFGGTYFPPEDRYGMNSFRRVLKAVADTYNQRRSDVDTNSAALMEALHRHTGFAAGDDEPEPEIFLEAFRNVARGFDGVEGGFGSAPKFPAGMVMDFLLRLHARTDRPDALHMVELSLEKMARGGIYDQIGGGFHRYSVDAHWLVPHFEKMLYDNAILARLYVDAHKITGKPFYRRVAEETFDYVLREMTAPEGAFYSTLDADSEGEEGKFYVWTPAEVEQVLGAEDARLFNSYFDVTARGNFEGKNILNVPRDLEAVAKIEGVSVERLQGVIERGRRELYAVRAKRVWPGLDNKTLTAWNGLMLRAFAEAGPALDRPDYTEVARRNADFLLKSMLRDGRLLRTYKEGEAKLNAYLEDYAYLIEGLVSLYEATFETRWLEAARQLADTLVAEFWDEAEGGFFFTGRSHEQLILRTKEYEDNASPSGNSSAAWGLLRLGELIGEPRYREKSAAILRAVQGVLARYARAFGHMLCALDFYLSSPVQIAIAGEPADERARALARAAHRRYLPSRVIAGAPPGGKEAALIPLLRDRPLVDGKPTAYVCRNFACQLPVTDVDGLEAQLGPQREAGHP
jgi:uncharacterized protein YyaL (SSP411 family)